MACALNYCIGNGECEGHFTAASEYMILLKINPRVKGCKTWVDIWIPWRTIMLNAVYCRRYTYLGVHKIKDDVVAQLLLDASYYWCAARERQSAVYEWGNQSSVRCP